MEVKEFIGHHGSSSVACKKIREVGFRASKHGWLGPGVYFFEDDENLAREWARNRNKGCRVDVIECILKVDKNRLLDISDPKSEQTKKINFYISSFFKKANECNYVVNLDALEIESKLIDSLCKSDEYEIVRNFTRTPTKEERERKKFCNHISNGVELCVRNKECINLK